MARTKSPKPQSDVDAQSAEAAAEVVDQASATEQKEAAADATASDGGPVPVPELGGDGTATSAGPGQPDPAPVLSEAREPEDGVTLSEAVRAGLEHAALTMEANAREPDLTVPDTAGWALHITGPARGRWRAGRFFAAEPVVIPAGELTEDEMIELRDDTTLSVVPVRAD